MDKTNSSGGPELSGSYGGKVQCPVCKLWVTSIDGHASYCAGVDRSQTARPPMTGDGAVVREDVDGNIIGREHSVKCIKQWRQDIDTRHVPHCICGVSYWRAAREWQYAAPIGLTAQRIMVDDRRLGNAAAVREHNALAHHSRQQAAEIERLTRERDEFAFDRQQLWAAKAASEARTADLLKALENARRAMIVSVTGISDGLTIHDIRNWIERADAAIAAAKGGTV